MKFTVAVLTCDAADMSCRAVLCCVCPDACRMPLRSWLSRKRRRRNWRRWVIPFLGRGQVCVFGGLTNMEVVVGVLHYLTFSLLTTPVYLLSPVLYHSTVTHSIVEYLLQ